MKTKKLTLTLLKVTTKIAMITGFIFIFSPRMVNGQNNYYHAGTTTPLTAATGQSGVARINCDVRALGSGNLSVIAWDGTAPSFYWKWTNSNTNGTSYSGTVSLPSGAWGPDVSILYDYNIDHNKAAITIVYETHSTGQAIDYMHYATWVYDHSNHTVSVLNSAVDISVSTYEWNYAAIDGETDGFCAMAWASNGDLHTIAGYLDCRFGDIYIDWGIDKQLNLPNIGNCPEIESPDVAIYGNNGGSAYAYIYYSYVRCGYLNLCEQTQHFDDIQVGSSIPSSAFTSFNYPAPAPYGGFTYPRIAANQYFALGGSGNGAKRNEFTIVAELFDYIGGNDYSSILAMTATNDGGSPNGYTNKLYNTTTNAYLGYTPIIYDFFATSGGNQYKTVENKLGFDINSNPVDAYDKNNDHIAICWSMDYQEGTYPTSFPIGRYPAHVYANPDFDGSNDPSMQTPNSIACFYNSLDNIAANTTSDDVNYMAVASHNTNELLYAWLNGSGTIYYKVVTSGVQPRLFNNNGNDLNVVFPNPYQVNTGTIKININNNEKYFLSVQTLLGETILQVSGQKYELQNKLTELLNGMDAGLYLLSIENDSHEIINQKFCLNK